MNGDLILSGLDNLEKIIVKENSLQNLNSLKICNNEELSNIEIENGVFSNVNNVIIESKFRNLMIWYLYLPKLQSLQTGNQSFFNTTSLSLSSRIYLYHWLFDLPNLQSFETGNQSFHMIRNLTFSSNSSCQIIIIILYRYSKSKQ